LQIYFREAPFVLDDRFKMMRAECGIGNAAEPTDIGIDSTDIPSGLAKEWICGRSAGIFV